MNLRKKFERFFKNTLTKVKKEIFFDVEVVDIKNEQFTISIRGQSVPIKLKFEDSINNIEIISLLPPIHAAWIGYFYGLNYLKYNNKYAPNNTEPQFNGSKSRYKLISEGRNKYINYLDQNTLSTKKAKPIEILSQKETISNFNSVDASFIGFLYGISKSKKRSNNEV